MRKGKRFLALLLSILLISSICDIRVLAENESWQYTSGQEGESDSEKGEPVAGGPENAADCGSPEGNADETGIEGKSAGELRALEVKDAGGNTEGTAAGGEGGPAGTGDTDSTGRTGGAENQVAGTAGVGDTETAAGPAGIGDTETAAGTAGIGDTETAAGTETAVGAGTEAAGDVSQPADSAGGAGQAGDMDGEGQTGDADSTGQTGGAGITDAEGQAPDADGKVNGNQTGNAETGVQDGQPEAGENVDSADGGEEPGNTNADRDEHEAESGETGTESSTDRDKAAEGQTPDADGKENGKENGAQSGNAETAVQNGLPGTGETAKPADEAQGFVFSTWSWNSGERNPQWSEENGRWELSVPGAGAASPLGKAGLEGLLPRTISVSDGKETRDAAVLWDLSAWPEEAYEGEYVLSASVEQGCTPGEEAPPVTLTVLLGQGEALEGEDQDFPNHRKEGLTPKGTSIHLFDYWLEERESPDHRKAKDLASQGTDVRTQGINIDHTLLFAKDTFGWGAITDKHNKWTQSAKPYSGIVEPVLVNGYPQVRQSLSNSKAESLAYLFSGKSSAYKQTFMDVGGLLQIDDEDYYYYDCTQNYAYFNESTRQFQLYDAPGIFGGGNTQKIGQFFPFTKPGIAFKEENGELTPQTTADGSYVSSEHEKVSHYFGLNMETRFIQQENGQTKEKKDVTYEFSGDDDVWIFIDDVLVADLGGIHDAASVKINFREGSIVINEGKVNEKGVNIQQDSTLKQAFEAAGRENSVKWSETNPNTFADNTYHTLKFFYLERGNSESNMSLKYNLVSVPETDIIKVDQLGEPVVGAEFVLYGTDENYTVTEDSPVIASGTTGEDGSFILVNEDGFVVSLNELQQSNIDHFVLKETKVPDGYRQPGEAHLYLDTGAEGKTVLLSEEDNYWETGIYANAKVTTAVDAAVTDTEGGTHSLDTGIMFGVILKYNESGPEGMGNPENWSVVYGDPVGGWETLPAELGNVLTAAAKNLYRFLPTNSGAYQVEIENLPGSIKDYYYMLSENEKDKAKYTVAYYYTSADTIEAADSSNTWRLASDGYDREFSARIYVPNIQNRLLVQKVDEEGQPVSGVPFALYEEEDITVREDGSYVLREGAAPHCTAVTADLSKADGAQIDLQGGAVLPTQDQAEAGEGLLCIDKTYYLVEQEAPIGYQKNPKAVKVIVDNSGIYADAGTEDDGIAVLRGAGSIVKSMVQFAAADSIDRTLHDIKAILRVSDTYKGEATQWQDQTDTVMHLQYQAEGAALEYGPAEEGGAVTLRTETGWSVLKIQQCLDAAHGGSQYKTDLGDRDLTTLFSRTALVQVTNRRTGGLKIEKKVEGDVPEGQEFSFDLTLKDTSGLPLGGSYQGTIYEAGGTAKPEPVSVINGAAVFTLKAGESILFSDLPAGTQFEIEEKGLSESYLPSVQGPEGCTTSEEKPAWISGTISQSTEDVPYQAVTYTNRYRPEAVLEGETALRVRKTLDGRPMTQDDSFAFLLEAGDDSTKQAVAAGTVILGEAAEPPAQSMTAEVSGNAEGSESRAEAAFGAITFKEKGIYTFRVSEILPEGVSEAAPALNGILYDTHTAMITVTVTEKAGSDKLTAEVRYNNETALSEEDREAADCAAFTNTLVGDFALRKVNKEGDVLSGAVFALYRLNCIDPETHQHDKELVETDENGALTGASAECWEQVGTKQESGEDGTVTFTALPISGTYRLVELQAPEGYTKPAGQWRVEYTKNADGAGGRFTVPEGGGVGNPPAVHEQGGIYQIINYPPSALPFSGNHGITAFLYAGAALMLAGAAGMIWYKIYANKKSRRRR